MIIITLLRALFVLIFSCVAVGCASIQSVGKIGPKQLNVYSVSTTDFLSANRMLVILDKKGNVAAYSGGTVPGAGTVGLETAASLTTAGAIAYGANAVKSGVQNAQANVTVKGVPSTFTHRVGLAENIKK